MWLMDLIQVGYRTRWQMLCDGCDHIIGNIPKPIRTSKSSPIEPLSVLRRGTTVERVVLHPFYHFSFVTFGLGCVKSDSSKLVKLIPVCLQSLTSCWWICPCVCVLEIICRWMNLMSWVPQYVSHLWCVYIHTNFPISSNPVIKVQSSETSN
jgi:hypothetical protein